MLYSLYRNITDGVATLKGVIMQNIIKYFNENNGSVSIIGVSGKYFEIAFECGAHIEINGDDMFIGDDDDHYVKIKNYEKWGVVDEGCDFLLSDPNGCDEILLCVG